MNNQKFISNKMNQKIFFDSMPHRLVDLFAEISSNEPWGALSVLEKYIQSIIKPCNMGVLIGDVHIEGDVEIGEGTTIERGAVIKGPTIIGKNCEVRNGAYIRGAVITGDRCVIGHTTEVIRSLLFDDVRIDHFNYVGDSVLGNKVHFGAGAKVANLRFDEGEIVFEDEHTKLKKFGAILGDRCKVGVNATIGPGVIFEKDVWYATPFRIPSGIYSRERMRMYLEKVQSSLNHLP